jgi:hypothetical protein
MDNLNKPIVLTNNLVDVLALQCMIQIELLGGYTPAAIKSLIEQEPTNRYHIVVPRFTPAGNGYGTALAYEYLGAAYAGQRLSELGRDFAFDDVPPEVVSDIGFHITTDDKEGLTNALLDIQSIYFDDATDDDNAYQTKLVPFWNAVMNQALRPACPSFLIVYADHLNN